MLSREAVRSRVQIISIGNLTYIISRNGDDLTFLRTREHTLLSFEYRGRLARAYLRIYNHQNKHLMATLIERELVRRIHQR